MQQHKKKRYFHRHKMSLIRLFTYFFKLISSTNQRKHVCRKNDDDDNIRRNEHNENKRICRNFFLNQRFRANILIIFESKNFLVLILNFK